MSAQGARRALPGQRLAIAASVVVAMTIVYALVVMGSPAQQRMRALDARRVQALNTISQAIDQYAVQKDTVPASLRDLAGAGQWLPLQDPGNRRPYAYTKTGDRTYRLCANFESSTQAADVGGGWGAGAWAHLAGQHCFDRKRGKADGDG